MNTVNGTEMRNHDEKEILLSSFQEIPLTDDQNSDQAEKKQLSASIPTKRISCDLMGDDALQAEILVTSLQIHGSKTVKDAALISLAIKALSKVVSDCSIETGKRFPNERDLLSFLD